MIRNYPALDDPAQATSLQSWFRELKESQFQMFSKSVAGGVDVALSLEESQRHYLLFTGALTGNINVLISTTPWQFTVFNNTSGAFTLTVKTSSGTGITIGQGKRAILICDGINVVRITPDT